MITDSEVMALQIIWIICPGQITGCCYLDLWSDCKTVSFLLTFWNSQCNNQIPTWCNNQPTLSSFVQDGAPIQTGYISLGVCGVILILHALVSNLNPAQSVYRFFFFKKSITSNNYSSNYLQVWTPLAGGHHVNLEFWEFSAFSFPLSHFIISVWTLTVVQKQRF